jgi:serine/threonine protein kinase
LGISKSVTESTDNEENYGIIPYMAPEILQGQKYTKASDIYSFGMIMWEFMTGRRPFWDRNHDIELIIDICDGLRPPIVTNAPEGYIELMKECWHSDPDKRPTADDIHEKVDKMYWREDNNPTKIIHSLDIGPVKTNHSGAIYKSRPLSSMINSAMSLWSLSQSIDFKKVKRKFKDDLIENENVNGMVLTQLQIKFLKIYKP